MSASVYVVLCCDVMVGCYFLVLESWREAQAVENAGIRNVRSKAACLNQIQWNNKIPQTVNGQFKGGGTRVFL